MIDGTSPKSILLAVDPSWKGTGWALFVAGQLRAQGVENLDATWRRQKLFELLERWEALIVDACRWHPVIRPRLVIERVPKKGGGLGRKAGARQMDPTVVVRALSELEGSIVQWAVRPGWEWPWELEPLEWRAGLGWANGKRGAVKRAAVALVSREYPTALRGLDLTAPSDPDAPWPAGDVAEAVVLGREASRRIAEAPRGPAAWLRVPFTAR